MKSQPTPADDIHVRTSLLPGDIGAIVQLHGESYANEYGFDVTFEAYVAGPLAEFAGRADPRERIWIAQHNGRIIGCIAIVAASARIAQLRWFLVHPSARGTGLGKRLLHEAVAFCKCRGYERIVLWTVSALKAAAHLYASAGFRKVEEKEPGRMWGVDVVEEKYEMTLA